MKTILTIDTSSNVCCVGLEHNNRLLFKQQSGFKSHAEIILDFVDQLLKCFELSVADIDIIVFVKGPGSFTGLRIAACVTQGLAVAHDIPTIGVSSLQAVAQGVFRILGKTHVWVVNDARMGEVYHAPFVIEGGIMTLFEKEQVSPLQQIQANSGFYYFGSGLAGCDTILQGCEFTSSNAYIDCQDLLTIAKTLEPKNAEFTLPTYIRNSVAKKKEQ